MTLRTQWGFLDAIEGTRLALFITTLLLELNVSGEKLPSQSMSPVTQGPLTGSFFWKVPLPSSSILCRQLLQSQWTGGNTHAILLVA